jgi:hypothetical protein
LAVEELRERRHSASIVEFDYLQLRQQLDQKAGKLELLEWNNAAQVDPQSREHSFLRRAYSLLEQGLEPLYAQKLCKRRLA